MYMFLHLLKVKAGLHTETDVLDYFHIKNQILADFDVAGAEHLQCCLDLINVWVL